MTYAPTVWVDYSPPCIDAAHLNNIEDGIVHALCDDGTVDGASTQRQRFAYGITLDDTISADTGVVTKDGNRFLHNFHHPVGGGALPDGRNTFLGELAGNFTMGSTATATSDSSYNVAVGYSTFQANTIGRYNCALGYFALNLNTTGYQNMAIGPSALRLNTSGYANCAVGTSALYNNSTGYRNIGIGTGTGLLITGGYGNVLIGHGAGDNITTGDRNIIIGYDVDAPNAAADYQLSIGNLIFGTNLDGTGTTISSGRIGIAVPTPLAKLHIDQPSDTEAIPVLTLDQADISEGTINFIASDRGVITGATDSVASVRVEINGVVRRLALYADA